MKTGTSDVQRNAQMLFPQSTQFFHPLERQQINYGILQHSQHATQNVLSLGALEKRKLLSYSIIRKQKIIFLRTDCQRRHQQENRFFLSRRQLNCHWLVNQGYVNICIFIVDNLIFAKRCYLFFFSVTWQIFFYIFTFKILSFREFLEARWQ